MAADGSIGGFSGQWGEGCKINKKRSLLQSEGVQFDAKTGKIVKECLLASIPPAATFDGDDDDDKLDSRKQVAKTTSTRPTKKQKTEKSGDDNTTSKYFAVTKKKKADVQRNLTFSAPQNLEKSHKAVGTELTTIEVST